MPLMDLSDRQKSVVATAVTTLSLVVILAAISALFWIAATFLKAFSHVFLPLAVAAVAAFVFRPYFDFLHTRLKMPTGLAIVVFFLSALIPLVAFGWFFGALIAEQISGMVKGFPEWWARIQERFREQWPQVVQFFQTTPTGQQIAEIAEAQKDTLLEGLQLVGGKALSAGAGVVRGVGAVAAWVVTPVYLIFFLMAERKPLRNLEGNLPFLKSETRKDVVFLVNEFINIIVAFFRGQLVIAFLQGVLYAIGFSIVGLKFGFVLGLLLGFLNIIPYLGSIIGLGVNIPLAYFQDGGGIWMVVWVVVVFTIVQLIESYLLTPKIMGDKTGLHPMAIIVAIFFWGSALQGILGMILAIPLTAFLVVFWRLAKERYIEEWV
jgi:predicted PurR-regulated permease PerM